MYNIKKALLVLAFSTLAYISNSQSLNTYSPYSRFGIGIMPNRGFTQNLGMGGVSQAIRNPYGINYLNPASYSAQDSMSFIFDFGVQTSSTSYVGYDQYLNKYSSSSSTGGIHHISIAFPISKKWGVAAGFAPYSSVGYKMIRFETDPYKLSTIGRIRYEHIGNGGISQAFIGTGFSPLKNLSIGINMLYYFGSLDFKYNTIFPLTNSDYVNTYYKSSIAVNDISFNLGFQYIIELDKEKQQNLILGATIEKQNEINIKYKWSAEMYGEDSYDTLVPFPDSKNNFLLPTNVNFGVAYSIKDKFIGSLEYFVQDWSKTESFTTNVPLTKMETFRAGIEYTPNIKDLRSYLKKIHYRLGGYYTKSNLLVNSNQISDYGITFGLGLPVKNKTRLNISLELGKRGTTENYLTKETYGNVSLSLTFYDYPWFFKRKYN
ncbi:MAG TPA: hypothetical protein PLH91_05445 [Tenuifilaceae bacterium]|nr:hypothetical protein [Tenuifilaceae bacterium]HPI44654.1 hypothetical protein [Tenuifilaceae bacterium]HPN20981.1 hypothetical protein [Tenuifilaceae bacterium]